MVKSLTITILAILTGWLCLAIWQTPLDASEDNVTPTSTPEQVEHGRILAGIGNCATCHTASLDKPYAGGLDFPTDFGTLYSANITPDKETGIGDWSREAFIRAMRKGVAADGSYLYPAFPYTHFKNITDEDLDALYAYLMSLEPIAQEPPENELRFPFNLRFLQWGWQLLFFDDEPLQPDPERSAEWNRGAYLAEGLGHCTACHSPRNAFGAEKKDKAYAGALVDNWYAPALDASQPVPVHWDEKSLYAYLRTGQSDYQGTAVGSMGEVVHKGLKVAPDKDIRAMAAYLATLGGQSTVGGEKNEAAKLIEAAHQRVATNRSRGEELYISACAACHFNAPENPRALRAELSLNSAVTADDPSNLLRVTLQGVAANEGTPGIVMPAFATFSDDDIANLAEFLRSRAGRPPWSDVHERLKDLRQLQN
ncbi:cytochrome c [Microbulbifer hainanensis]|uniref:cytochrome c n=1 Tax=Microbulbifer hainanensis TaxID=2735675 RepID=UPI0018682347|nr:cytochrome c [Microbulbifer hainanensis]